MLAEFLRQHQREILTLTEEKTLELAGDHPTSAQLKQGLPTFYGQVIDIIGRGADPAKPPEKDKKAIASAADSGDEPAMAEAAGQPEEADLAESAGRHGVEYLRLGYTLSHVVHAYGALCQAITEVASKRNVDIEIEEFHALNRCLDVAIAGAVTEYEHSDDAVGREGRPAGSKAREMLGALMRAKVAFQAMQAGTVGAGGSTARVLAASLNQLQELLEGSLSGGKAPRTVGD
jgi:hypothetical protein